MIRKLLQQDARALYRAYAFRVTILAAISAAAAYLIGKALPFVSPEVAVIIALAAIKPTFHDTVRESIRQVVGTLVGALFGLVFVALLGFNIYTLTGMVLVSFIMGWLLKLRAEGGITIAVTVVLVTGPLLGNIDNVTHRLFGVILGAICALTVSYFIKPGHPHQQVLSETIQQSKDISKLLKTISIRFREGGLTLDEATEWQTTIDAILEDVSISREEIWSAYEDAKWSPLIQKHEVEQVITQVKITKANAHSVQSICYAITKALSHDTVLPEKISQDIGKMLAEASTAIKEQAKLAKISPADAVPEEKAQNIRERRRKVAASMRNLDDTQMILLSGTILHEATKIKDTVEAPEDNP